MDTAILLEAIAGYDEVDATSVDWPTDNYTAALGTKERPRIGVVREPFFEALDSEIEDATNRALKVIGDMSMEILEVKLPPPPAAVQAPEVYAVHAKYFASTPKLYRPWMRERLAQAAAVDALSYVISRRELDQVRSTINAVFSTVDLLVTPTTPVPPITIEEALNMTTPPLPGELWLRNTRPFNAYGLPTISIPCGFTQAGLPIGLQIAGPRFAEGRVLAFAHTLEQSTDWHKNKGANRGALV
jgi:aspartyl-tRNA(Asn)/glutamyl-tRNA(Gln) amidotransferase subunit A